MSQIEGGDLVDVIDGACAAIDVGSVFSAAVRLTIPGAFCAGWSLGRLFS